MGKVPKPQKGNSARAKASPMGTAADDAQRTALHDEINQNLDPSHGLSVKKRSKTLKKERKMDEEEAIGVNLPKKVVSSIMKEAKEQRREIAGDEDEARKRQETVASFANALGENYEVEEFTDDEDAETDVDNESVIGDFFGDEAIDEEEERKFAMFMSKPLNLADLIMQKIEEKKAGRGEMDAPRDPAEDMDPKIVDVYTRVGQLMKVYTSGKLPKAFKVIPSLTMWEDILWITRPENWSPAATRQATRLFASNLNEKMAQRFYHNFLLPKVREDIASHKKLNFHLYLAVKKALYKPAAFYKGFLLALCQEGNCTLREAIIVASILKKVSVPPVHSAVALLKLADMEYSGASSIFIRTLLMKKYALPRQVLDALVRHFVKFGIDDRELPVRWHQCLLSLAERYREQLTGDQKEALKALMKKHFHPKITPEIRRQLFGQTGSAAMDVSR